MTIPPPDPAYRAQIEALLVPIENAIRLRQDVRAACVEQLGEEEGRALYRQIKANSMDAWGRSSMRPVKDSERATLSEAE